VADAEVVAFVDAELLELDAALAWARPVKPARITPPPTAAATSERRIRDLIKDHPLRSSRRHSTIATFRSAWARLRVRSEALRGVEEDVAKAPSSPGKRGGRPGYA
jgi:hypothetical protein